MSHTQVKFSLIARVVLGVVLTLILMVAINQAIYHKSLSCWQAAGVDMKVGDRLDIPRSNDEVFAYSACMHVTPYGSLYRSLKNQFFLGF